MHNYTSVCGYKPKLPANDNPMPASRFSADELLVLRRMIRGEYVEFKNSGLQADQWRSFMHRLGREAGKVA